MQSRFLQLKSTPKTLISLTVIAWCFLALQGCSSLPSLDSRGLLPNTAQEFIITRQPHNLARLILVQPRETLLPFFGHEPVELYAEDTHLATIAQGQYFYLDAQEFQTPLTLHWFDYKNPNISRTLELDLNIQAGEQGVVQLTFGNGEDDEKHQQAELTATVLPSEDALMAMPWLVEAKSYQTAQEDNAVASHNEE